MGVSFNSSYRRRSFIPVVAILVLACALRTIQYLGRGSFWFDELSLALNIQQFREIDQFRGRPRVWFFYTHSAPGYREPEVIRSYLRTIGEKRDRIPDPFDGRGQGEAAAYLYDLSDRKRLATTTWDRYQFPKPTPGAPRVLCDGTRVGTE